MVETKDKKEFILCPSTGRRCRLGQDSERKRRRCADQFVSAVPVLVFTLWINARAASFDWTFAWFFECELYIAAQALTKKN